MVEETHEASWIQKIPRAQTGEPGRPPGSLRGSQCELTEKETGEGLTNRLGTHGPSRIHMTSPGSGHSLPLRQSLVVRRFEIPLRGPLSAF